MSDAFVVYVRYGEKVLILQRSDEVADFPGAWDGVYGVGDPEDIDAVTTSCLLYTSPSPRDRQKSRMPSSA